MMHSNSFDVIYDIDETSYSCCMINLLLQPLVENAIVHGIDHKVTDGRGTLTISCHIEDNLLVFRISDNGCGMTDNKMNTILTSETTGYGVKNVHQRVQLYYGEAYGLSYESEVDKGTCTKLVIPM